MIIDKIGGTSPGYGPKKPESTSRTEKPVRSSDNVSISREASRTAEAARIVKLAKAEDPERAEKLKEIKQKLEKGEYDNIGNEILSRVADKIADSFTTGG